MFIYLIAVFPERPGKPEFTIKLIKGFFEVTMNKYDQECINEIKTIPDAKFRGENRSWNIPIRAKELFTNLSFMQDQSYGKDIQKAAKDMLKSTELPVKKNNTKIHKKNLL